jgi:hypothetical protein
MLTCTRCDGTGFLNIEQVDEATRKRFDGEGMHSIILDWISKNTSHDVQVCDCCGNNDDGWYGIPGIHYTSDDPRGPHGPYAYNGGLCECN